MNASLALPLERFSVITLANPDDAVPMWSRLMHWPDRGDHHIAMSVDGNKARGLWAAQLDDAVKQADRAVLIVADGLYCSAASWWARLSPAQYVERVAGALFFGPSDEETPPSPFRAPPLQLPFPSIALTGQTNRQDEMRALVEPWGSRLMVGARVREPVRHSTWRTAQKLVERATMAMVKNDMRRARKLIGIDS